MYKNISKILAISLLIIFIFVSITGCGSTSANSASDQTKQTEKKEEPKQDETKKDESKAAGQDKKLKLGYVQNFSSHEFYKNIGRGAKEAAEKTGVDFEIADANLDINKQISMCETMLAKKVDALIVTPVDPKGIMPIIEKAMGAGIPVITESVKAPKQTCYIGIDDFAGGYLDGKYAGEYVKKNNFPTPKALLVGLPALEACVNRTEGFKKGLLEVVPDAKIVAEVDGSGAKDKAMAKATDALTAHPDINLIMGINDDSTLGGVQAYKAAGKDLSKLIAFGFGVEGVAAKNELTDAKGPYQGGLAMFPENIGRLLVETAIKAAKKETVPESIQVPFTVMNKENVATYYKKQGDDWLIIWDEVLKIQSK